MKGFYTNKLTTLRTRNSRLTSVILGKITIFNIFFKKMEVN